MVNWNRVPTTVEVWRAIKLAHPDLGVFSSYSNPTGDDGLSSQPQMMTEYGLPGADAPLMGALTTWERGAQDHERINEQHQYWLCAPIETD